MHLDKWPIHTLLLDSECDHSGELSDDELLGCVPDGSWHVCFSCLLGGLLLGLLGAVVRLDPSNDMVCLVSSCLSHSK